MFWVTDSDIRLQTNSQSNKKHLYETNLQCQYTVTAAEKQIATQVAYGCTYCNQDYKKNISGRVLNPLAPTGFRDGPVCNLKACV
jgi:hypothetical protein